MTNFKQNLTEAEYQYAQSGTSIPGDEDELTVEMDRRLKLFGYDRNGASEFQMPFDDLWTGKKGYTTGHSRHVQLVDPDYKKIYGTIDWQDPETLRRNIQAVRKGNPENYAPKNWDDGGLPATVFASAQIAQFEQGVKDAEHYQKIKSQIPQLLQKGSKGKSPGAASAKSDPKVKELQDRILAKDPRALPKYGADGVMGKETQAAMQRLGIKESLELQRIIDLAKF